MDEAALKIERGIQAKALLDSPAFSDAVNRLMQNYFDIWLAAKTPAAREDMHRYVTILQHLKADLTSTATTGTLTKQRTDLLQGQPTPIWRRALG